MTRLIASFAAAAVLVAMAPASPAQGGVNGGCGLVFRIGGTLYIDERSGGHLLETPGATWLYMESNGKPGLQAGGRAIHGLYADTSCSQSSNPDQLIF